MKTFIPLTVAFTKDKNRVELINMGKVYRIIEKGNGCLVCFNASGSENMEVKESRAEIEKLIG